MIRLQHSLIQGLETAPPTVEGVCTVLQQAVKLEHATIPLYLYALYSLNATANRDVAEIIQSVVIEEMLHMTLASNVLNALGGNSEIDQPDFTPTYPGPLPGSVDKGQSFNLAPFSMGQIGQPPTGQLAAFLEIERPADPIDLQARKLNLADGALDDSITIGEFYTAISKAIGVLGDSAFVNPPRNQVGPDLMDESVVVVDVATAQQAINIIIEQGEGTSSSPEEVVGTDFAHYYRFMQIQKGKRLAQVSGSNPPQYTYSGAPITFNLNGVYAVPTNPALTPYPAGSAQAFANDNFNYTYTSLLLALHGLFSGQAAQTQMNTAIGLMMSLKGQAKAMMSGIPNPAVLTGPSFVYQPVNPLGT